MAKVALVLAMRKCSTTRSDRDSAESSVHNCIWSNPTTESVRSTLHYASHIIGGLPTKKKKKKIENTKIEKLFKKIF